MDAIVPFVSGIVLRWQISVKTLESNRLLAIGRAFIRFSTAGPTQKVAKSGDVKVQCNSCYNEE